MAITNKALTAQVEREARIIVDAIERGDAEFAGRAARILFQTLDKLIIESKLVPCPYCSEGDPGQCGACHNTRRVMLSQQHEYSLHIRPVPNAACPECIADKLVADAEADRNDRKENR